MRAASSYDEITAGAGDADAQTAPGQTPQAAVIAALQSKRGPLRTRDVRERINHNRQEPLVNERVYQALMALYQRGLVTRRESPDCHHVYWQLLKTCESGTKP